MNLYKLLVSNKQIKKTKHGKNTPKDLLRILLISFKNNRFVIKATPPIECLVNINNPKTIPICKSSF